MLYQQALIAQLCPGSLCGDDGTQGQLFSSDDHRTKFWHKGSTSWQEVSKCSLPFMRLELERIYIELAR